MLGDVKMIHSSIVVENENNQIVFPRELLNWYYDNNQGKIIFMWNESNRIVFLSEQITIYTGIRVEELLGQDWTYFFTSNEKKKIERHFAHSSEKYSLQNVKLIDEKEHETLFKASIDQITIGNELIYICEFDNSTYIQELERMVVNSEKLVLAAQLSAGLVHEIRNPLTSLKGFLQLVQSGVQQKNEYYRVMIGEIEKLEKITTELLQMARPFKHQMQIEKVHALLEDVSFMMNTQSNMRELTLEVQCDEDLSIYCNASQMKQVFINLILNGAEAMQKKGTILINAYQLDHYIVIDIIDEGEGVSPEIVHELQQPFFTTKEKGTGLGLVITQHLLELHRAELKIKANESKGSTFSILLPISNEQ